MLFRVALTLTVYAGIALANPPANPFSIDQDAPDLMSSPAPVKQVTPETSLPKDEPETIAPKAQTEASTEKETPSKLNPTIPKLTAPVIDQAGILGPNQVSELSREIISIRKSGGPQIQVLIVKNLEGFPIEEYSIAVAEAWKIGSKEKGDGVIILMSQDDREVRIEVGEGIEGDLTDAESHQVIQYGMIPEFRKGDFYKGFKVAIESIAAKFGVKSLNGRDLTPPEKLVKMRRSNAQLASLLLPVIIFFITFPFFMKLLGKNPVIRSFAGAAYLGALTFFLVGHLFFILLAIFIGFFIGLVGPLNFLMVMLSNSGRGGYGRGGFGGGGGWSGGGGGFSGGGASGRW